MEASPRHRRSVQTSSGSQHSSDAIIKLSMLKKLTVGLKDMYTAIYNSPSKRKNFELKYGDTIKNGQYVIYRELGKGSFGHVYEAFDQLTQQLVAIKVIKPRKSYLIQAQKEIKNLRFLNERDNKKGFIVKMFDDFIEEGYVCIVFEMLSKSLYRLIKDTNFKGLALSQVRVLAWQILMALSLLSLPNVQIIHCDLKPENVMIREVGKCGIKVIDFGSSCSVGMSMYKYIQSRYYRAPEVLLELPYGTPIDVWSAGCILAELYTGSPLFIGADKVDQLAAICEVRGNPPLHMMLTSPKCRYFFRTGKNGKLVLKNPRQTKTTLTNLLKAKENVSPSELGNFVDLVGRMLDFDPKIRITPYDALRHQFFKDGNGEQNSFPVPAFNSKSPFLRSNSSYNLEAFNQLTYRRADSTFQQFRMPTRQKPGSMIFPGSVVPRFGNQISPFITPISKLSTGASEYMSTGSSYIFLSPDALEILGRPGSTNEELEKVHEIRTNSCDPNREFKIE